MPKIAYSKQQREQIRENLIVLAQELMSIQGVRHTTIEQIYQRAGLPSLTVKERQSARNTFE